MTLCYRLLGECNAPPINKKLDMYIELSNGQSVETDDPYVLENLLFFVDNTFPYDNIDGIPCAIYNQSYF